MISLYLPESSFLLFLEVDVMFIFFQKSKHWEVHTRYSVSPWWPISPDFLLLCSPQTLKATISHSVYLIITFYGKMHIIFNIRYPNFIVHTPVVVEYRMWAVLLNGHSVRSSTSLSVPSPSQFVLQLSLLGWKFQLNREKPVCNEGKLTWCYLKAPIQVVVKMWHGNAV